MPEVYAFPSGMVDVEGGRSTLTLQVKRNLKSQAVSIGNTATAIPATPIQYRRSVIIENNGTNPIYIGGADVTVANGFPVYPRGVIRIDIAENIIVYGIVASGTEEIRCLEGA